MVISKSGVKENSSSAGSKEEESLWIKKSEVSSDHSYQKVTQYTA